MDHVVARMCRIAQFDIEPTRHLTLAMRKHIASLALFFGALCIPEAAAKPSYSKKVGYQNIRFGDQLETVKRHRKVLECADDETERTQLCTLKPRNSERSVMIRLLDGRVYHIAVGFLPCLEHQAMVQKLSKKWGKPNKSTMNRWVPTYGTFMNFTWFKKERYSAQLQSTIDVLDGVRRDCQFDLYINDEVKRSKADELIRKAKAVGIEF